MALILAACGQDDETRRAFLEGTSAEKAALLVRTKDPRNVEAVASFFRDKGKAYGERLKALRALRLLAKLDPKQYARVYKTVQPDLSLEASRGQGMSALKAAEEEMLLEAIAWHAEMRYEHAMYVLEHYVDTEINRARKVKLSPRVRNTSALLLGLYPPRASARDTLWATFVERREKEALRRACYEALRRHMKDLRSRVLALPVSSEDPWLFRFQEKLRKEK